MAERIVMHAPLGNGKEAEAGLDDDDAVDLLTQAQHVSGRSDQDQLHPALDHNQSQGQSFENGNAGMAFPESIEQYEEVAAQDGTEISSEEDQDDQNDDSAGLNGEVEPETVQTQGLVDLEAFMDGEEEGVEEEEELEEQEEVEEDANDNVGTLEQDDQEEQADFADQAEEQDAETIASTKASIGDAAQTLDLDEEETLETQESWNIRKGKAGPVQTQQIIRGVQQKT